MSLQGVIARVPYREAVDRAIQDEVDAEQMGAWWRSPEEADRAGTCSGQEGISFSPGGVHSGAVSTL
jgi:hypothetical protein